jgi:hypothetical protein
VTAVTVGTGISSSRGLRVDTAGGATSANAPGVKAVDFASSESV